MLPRAGRLRDTSGRRFKATIARELNCWSVSTFRHGRDCYLFNDHIGSVEMRLNDVTIEPIVDYEAKKQLSAGTFVKLRGQR